MLLQSECFASYGNADSLCADGDTIRRFIGQSSLPVVDQLSILFLRRFTLCQATTLVQTMPVIPPPNRIRIV
jgi:hypothetical protein